MGEPDFEVALREYKQAIDTARSKPAADEAPGLRDCEVVTAWTWLAGMFERHMDGTPPVTRAEFEALAGWLEANRERLYRLSEDGTLDLGDGRRESLANLLYRAAAGPRSCDAGRAAEDLRRVRERYGLDGLAPNVPQITGGAE